MRLGAVESRLLKHLAYLGATTCHSGGSGSRSEVAALLRLVKRGLAVEVPLGGSRMGDLGGRGRNVRARITEAGLLEARERGFELVFNHEEPVALSTVLSGVLPAKGGGVQLQLSSPGCLTYLRLVDGALLRLGGGPADVFELGLSEFEVIEAVRRWQAAEAAFAARVAAL